VVALVRGCWTVLNRGRQSVNKQIIWPLLLPHKKPFCFAALCQWRPLRGALPVGVEAVIGVSRRGLFTFERRGRVARLILHQPHFNEERLS
jgi:hypothetical protein